MRVRATLRLRNDHMITARQELGLNQKQLSVAAEVALADIGFFESFQYGRIYCVNEKARRIAAFLHMDVDLILEPGSEDVVVDSTRVAVAEVNIAELPAPATMQFLPQEAAEASERDAALMEVIESLPFREREITRMRYGLSGQWPHTLDECAEVFKISRGRVQQIERQVLGRLRAPWNANKLRPHIED